MILKKIFLLIGLLVLFQIAGVVASLTNITNCTDLQAMDDNLTNDYQLMNNIDCSDTINWNSGAGFNQIGDDSTSCFRGNFSGNGYNITDLYINRTDDNYRDFSGCVWQDNIASDEVNQGDCNLDPSFTCAQFNNDETGCRTIGCDWV